jgi:hypothetical protein
VVGACSSASSPVLLQLPSLPHLREPSGLGAVVTTTAVTAVELVLLPSPTPSPVSSCCCCCCSDSCSSSCWRISPLAGAARDRLAAILCAPHDARIHGHPRACPADGPYRLLSRTPVRATRKPRRHLPTQWGGASAARPPFSRAVSFPRYPSFGTRHPPPPPVTPVTPVIIRQHSPSLAIRRGQTRLLSSFIRRTMRQTSLAA